MHSRIFQALKTKNNNQKKKSQREQNSCPPNLTVSDKQLQNTMALLKLKAPRVPLEHMEVVSLQVTPTKRHTEQNHSSQPADRQPKQSFSKKSLCVIHVYGWRLLSSEAVSSMVIAGWHWSPCSNGGGAHLGLLNPKLDYNHSLWDPYAGRPAGHYADQL